jgi:hypothetical protein
MNITKNEEGKLHLKLRLSFKTIPAFSTVSNTEVFSGVANYVTITMGGMLRHFESPIPKDGILDIDHVFEKIPTSETYHNQIGWSERSTPEMMARGLNYNIEVISILLRLFSMIFTNQFQKKNRTI